MKTQRSPKLNTINGSQGGRESSRSAGANPHPELPREQASIREYWEPQWGTSYPSLPLTGGAALDVGLPVLNMDGSRPTWTESLPASPPTHHLSLFRAEGGQKAGCSLMNWGVSGSSDMYFLGHGCGSDGG